MNPPEGIVVRIQGELPHVWYDAIQFEQIMQNLIENAVKYMGQPAGTVMIRAVSKRDDWCFTVEDTGVGIDPAHHQRIFKMFQRLHTGEEPSSSGIGLAVVKRAVEEMGGHIWVRSSPGTGSAFSFTVPRRPVAFDTAKTAGLV